MKNKKNIIVWGLLGISLLIIFQNYFNVNGTLIKYVLKNDKYQQVDINIEDYVDIHDCVLEENRVIITGDDPYIVYYTPRIQAYDITINNKSIIKYTGNYKIYFSDGTIFSEDFVGKKEREMDFCYSINSNVQAVRVDFEGVTKDEYTILEKKIATINDNTRIPQLISLLVTRLFLVCIYIVISYLYTILLIYRKMYRKYYVNLIYIVLSSDIVINASSFRKITLLIMTISLLIGMFLIQKNVSTERETMKNE